MTDNFLVFNHDIPQRLDIFLLELFPSCSRSFIQKRINNNNVKVNSRISKASYKIKKGDIISYKASDFIDRGFLPDIIEPLDYKLDIIYEDDNVIIINKPAGIAIHPSIGNENNTIVNALINYDKNIADVVHDQSSQLSLSRPGIIHRLDKDTSGIMVIAKNINTLYYLSAQIKSRNIKKIYRAICFGWPINDSGKLINFLGRSNQNRLIYTEVGPKKGRESILNYQVENCFKDIKNNKYSYLEFDLVTGRTHQIRAQSLLLGNPIIGDKFYHTKESLSLSSNLGAIRQMLHAYKLSLYLQGDDMRSEFTAPIPEDMYSITSSGIIT